EPVVVRVVVEQLDDEVLLGHRPAHQRVAAPLLGVREGEVRVSLHRDLSLHQEALARRALALAAAVDEGQALANGGVEHGLIGRPLDLLADRLEADLHRSETPVRRSDSACSSGTLPLPFIGTPLWSPVGSPSSRATRMFGEWIVTFAARM